MKKLILAAFALTTAASVFAQGSINFNNRIGGATFSQTGHVWGPSATDPMMHLIGLGSNDNPAGTTDFAGAHMALIGAVGSSGAFGYATTYAQLIGALGSNQPEASLTPFAGVTTFRSGTSLGGVAAIASTLPSNYADAPWATVEIVAWDNSSGNYPTWTQASVAWQANLIAAGHSAPFNVANIGGTANLAPFLTSAGTIAGFSFNLIPGPEPSTLALAGLGAAVLMIARGRKKPDSTRL